MPPSKLSPGVSIPAVQRVILQEALVGVRNMHPCPTVAQGAQYCICKLHIQMLQHISHCATNLPIKEDQRVEWEQQTPGDPP